tara:strand:+ start:55 stop:198 length:144 start_codon:yes stop_codon:yes gene_type:complete
LVLVVLRDLVVLLMIFLLPAQELVADVLPAVAVAVEVAYTLLIATLL